MIRALAVAAAVSSGCSAWATMDRTDRVLEATHALATAADAMTTYRVTADCLELNPIIGRCGGGVPIPVYFLVFQVVHTALVLTLPPGRARTVVQTFTLATEAHAAYKNVMIQVQDGRGMWPW